MVDPANHLELVSSETEAHLGCEFDTMPFRVARGIGGVSELEM